MAENKTKKTTASPETFLNTIKEEQRRKDGFTILELMKKAAKSEPKMWGSAIIGLGDFKYTLSGGKENPWFMIGFSPRKQSFAFYLMGEKGEKYETQLGKIGKYSREKGCFHIKKIADIDVKTLSALFEMQVKACEKALKENK
jgi:Domain of unknown function (DU1801)